MKLSPKAFNRHLALMGENAAWRRAYACPCINPTSGAADPACPHCGGKGRAWADPVNGVTGVAGEKIQRQWAQLGVWEAGDVVLTIPSNSPIYAMGQFDRVVLSDSTQPFSVNLMPGEILDFPVVSIDRVYWLDDDKAEVNGDIPDIDDDGRVDWGSTANEPPHNKTYAITGRRHPEYFCYGEFPQDRALHYGAALPRRVVLRRYDLYGR